jgi:hypothetical protein
MYNLANLLKFIKEDAVIQNEETKNMLELAIGKEKELIDIIERIKKNTRIL